MIPTSTPIDSLNIHEFFGLFTRATTRGTWYSIFARVDATRFTSSEPVAAMSTSALITPHLSSTSGLVPLPSTTFWPGSSSCSLRTTSRLLSTTTTDEPPSVSMGAR